MFKRDPDTPWTYSPDIPLPDNFPAILHGVGAGTYSADTAKAVPLFQAHETFNHHVSDSQSQQTELTYITRIQTLITQIIQKP